VERFRQIVASSAEDFWFEEIKRLANPLAIGLEHALLAFGAPGVGSGVIGIVCGPEEADAITTSQAIHDVLADERFRLWTVN
jgi:hypothetical protein